MKNQKSGLTAVFLISLIFITQACSPTNTEIVQVNESAGPAISETAAPVEPEITPTITPTMAPIAANVNSRPIYLAEFDEEFQRYQTAAAELALEEDISSQKKIVLDDLINLTLLSQGALESGYELSEEELTQKIADLTEESGGVDVFQGWLSANFFTEESFRKSYSRSLEAAWMRNYICSQVPEEIEQIHALQIFVENASTANQIFLNLEGGVDFAQLAEQYDSITKGDIGWFPKGFLFDQELDEAAFSLEPGQYSQVIETDIGYHILYVVERELHPLSSNAREMVCLQALHDWIEAKRQESNIQIFVEGIDG